MLTASTAENNITFREMFKSSLLSEFPSVEILEAGDEEGLFKKLVSYSVDLSLWTSGYVDKAGLSQPANQKDEGGPSGHKHHHP